MRLSTIFQAIKKTCNSSKMRTIQWTFYAFFLIAIDMVAVATPMRPTRVTARLHQARPIATISEPPTPKLSYRCLIIAIGHMNRVIVDYHLVGEHSKGSNHTFEYRLHLGSETYTGAGSSKRKAQETISEAAYRSTHYRKPDSNNKICVNDPSPVNKLQEWAKKRNTLISYIVKAEVRRPEPKFTIECLLGEYNLSSSGEATNKKLAKAAAAKNMLLTLERLQINVDMEETIGSLKVGAYNTTNSTLLHPISRLFEIQAIRHAAEPVFRRKDVIDVGEPNLKQYLFEIGVGKLRELGSGKSPKEARKQAAHNMLKQMGFIVQEY